MAMNLVAGWSLLSALLVLGVQGEVPAGELSEIQNKTIQLVMEKFHQRDLSNGYRMTSVVKAVEELYVAGLFVNVEFLVKQTSCHKHHWTKPECQPTKNAKTYNCFGCFKFEHESHTVFSHVEECVLPRHLNQVNHRPISRGLLSSVNNGGDIRSLGNIETEASAPPAGSI
ncbi:retinoic acid receptor responder protein 2-like [Pyxicephalus adspersus]|uniref:retinoic acid receptor responder protein 2-like n=1 Tax=Pyxicephalus adspersus TaxID=30357 RepID=UPI003B59EF6D